MCNREFKKAKDLTTKIKNKVPNRIQKLIWNAIKKIDVEADYMQKFKLRSKNNRQIIWHEQENPRYQKRYKVIINNALEANIFVVIRNDYLKMMFAKEYNEVFLKNRNKCKIKHIL